ncbi:MAG: glycosyltransferase [Flavisolibacter sp.]|jgi:glycosyltransferase involved in cell wall biosynthesis
MNNKIQTLVILTPGFAASEMDDTCLPMQQFFIRTLKKNYPHINIFILSFHYPYRKDTYELFNATIFSLNGRNRGGLFKFLLRQKVLTALRQIKREHNITGLLSFWYNECALIGKKFADENGIKHYCWLLGQDARKTNKYPRRVGLNANELIALSDSLQDEFERSHGIKPFTVVPPGADMGQLIATPVRDIDLLAAGSLIPIKRFHVFLEVVAEIKTLFPNINAVLIGDGPEKEQLQKLTKKLGIEKNVCLAGKLAYNDVLQQMQKAKIFLHPSSYEGFSGVCQEALSCGVHVISFCKAMDQEIEQWHIVQSKKEMREKAIEILQNNKKIFTSITPYCMDDSAKKIMEIFEIKPLQN